MSATNEECLVEAISTDLTMENPAEAARLRPVDEYDRYVLDKRREFSRLAPLYELLADLATLGIARRMWRMVADIAAGASTQHVLELCCGTGRVTAHLAGLFRRVTGVDLSPAMLARARSKVRRLRLANVELREAEVSTVRFAPRSLDALVISLGMHELPEGIRAVILERAAKWIRPGGRVVIFDYRWPVSRLVSRLFTLGRFYFERNHFVDYLDYHRTLDIRLAEHGFAPVEKKSLFLSCLEIGVWEKIG